MQMDDSNKQEYDLLDLILDMVKDEADKELVELLLHENDDQKVFQLLLKRMKKVKSD